MPPLGTESTTFSRDVFGRYVCNTFEEAVASTQGGNHFDVIVVGGGSFGGVLAHRLFQLDRRARRHRILVLEAGPLLLPEHVQNLPQMGEAMKEVMAKPWTSPPGLGLTFPGLTVCLAGRSLFWGGWSPQLTDSELADWALPALAQDCKAAHFPEAKRQIGTDTANDFIFGPLHDALRNRLWAGIGNVTHAFEVASPGTLEAPLAIISSAARAGTYPINKFSAIQLLMDAARRAWEESNRLGGDPSKRLMIVPNCTVRDLVLAGNTVSAVRTNRGDVAVPNGGAVVVALGTIESARLVLNSSFPDPQKYIGSNLMAHLRSNVTLRIPRGRLGVPADRLYASALFLKGKSPKGHFHLQITASAAGPNETDSEAELFKKIPDIDTLDRFDLDDEHVIITLRGIGEMVSERAGQSRNRVELAAAPPGQQVLPPPANVLLSLTQQDFDLWEHLDRASDEAAYVFAGNQPFQVRLGNQWLDVAPGQAGKEIWQVLPHDGRRRDNLGTTHHEAGTLWMGDSASNSVTDTWGRFHAVPNAWAVGPALFPTVGSPNPMLTGVALARRTAERMFEKPFAEPPGKPITLFNGTDLSGWQQAGPGRFKVVNGTLVTEGGMGLLWYATHQFRDFELRLDWMVQTAGDNSGVFVRFPEPVVRDQTNQLVGDPWVAIREGYEVQIDDQGAPDGAMIHKTGALYGAMAPSAVASKPPGQWNTYVIRVEGQTYNVTLNSQVVVANFQGNRSVRGHVGFQNHLQKDQVAFRNIVVTPL